GCSKWKIPQLKKEILRIISIPIHCIPLKSLMLNLHWPMRSLMSATNFYAKDIFAWIRIHRKAEWCLTGLLLSKIRGSLLGLRVQVRSHRPHSPTPSPRERERCVKSLISFYCDINSFLYSAFGSVKK